MSNGPSRDFFLSVAGALQLEAHSQPALRTGLMAPAWRPGLFIWGEILDLLLAIEGAPTSPSAEALASELAAASPLGGPLLRLFDALRSGAPAGENRQPGSPDARGGGTTGGRGDAMLGGDAGEGKRGPGETVGTTGPRPRNLLDPDDLRFLWGLAHPPPRPGSIERCGADEAPAAGPGAMSAGAEAGATAAIHGQSAVKTVTHS